MPRCVFLFGGYFLTAMVLFRVLKKPMFFFCDLQLTSIFCEMESIPKRICLEINICLRLLTSASYSESRISAFWGMWVAPPRMLETVANEGLCWDSPNLKCFMLSWWPLAYWVLEQPKIYLTKSAWLLLAVKPEFRLEYFNRDIELKEVQERVIEMPTIFSRWAVRGEEILPFVF